MIAIREVRAALRTVDPSEMTIMGFRGAAGVPGRAAVPRDI
jgi:hypothetical protein